MIILIMITMQIDRPDARRMGGVSPSFCARPPIIGPPRSAAGTPPVLHPPRPFRGIRKGDILRPIVRIPRPPRHSNGHLKAKASLGFPFVGSPPFGGG